MKFFIVLAFILSWKGWAQEKACDLKSPQELFDRFKEHHPRLQENIAQLSVLREGVSQARQVPNPNIQLQALKGDTVEGDLEMGSVNLFHTVEWGNKLESRVALAKSYEDKSQFLIKDKNESLLIDALLKAYRLRQIRETIPLYIEAKEALTAIKTIRKRRGSLSPQEEAELEVLDLAIQDYQLKTSRFQAEEFNLEHHLSLYMGEDCILSKAALPQKILPREEFDLNQNLDEAVKNYARLNKAKKGLELAQNSLKLAKSNVYPDIKIGPSFQRQVVNGISYDAFGLSLQMGIPLLNTNKGTRAMKVQEIQKATIELKNTLHEAKHDLGVWIKRYNSLKKVFNDIASEKELRKKHKNIESLFKRGVISSSQIVNSHQRLIDFSKTKNQYEIDIVRAVWNIYKIQGRVFKASL